MWRLATTALLLLCAIAVRADAAPPCFTHFIELSGASLSLSDGDGITVCPSIWRTNQRTVHAAALATHGADVALICHYAETPGTLRLERYSLDSAGTYLDGVDLARPASASVPQRMCLTNYAAFVLEADGTLTRYDRPTGQATPLAPSAAAARFADIECTESRLFAISGALVVELDVADALLLHVVLRLPAPRHIELVASDGTSLFLRVELGQPAVFSALLDVDAHSLVAFADVQTAVTADGSADAQAPCVLTQTNAYSGSRTTLATELRAACSVLPGAADGGPVMVVADGLVWFVNPVSGAAMPTDGALYNEGNLGLLHSVAPVSSVDSGVAVFDVGGRGVLVTLDAGACNASVDAARLPSLSGLGGASAGGGLRMLSLSDAGALWLAGTTVMARDGLWAAADVTLPPLGGAVFDGMLSAGGDITLLLATKLHYVSVAQVGVSSEVPLPAALSGAVQQLTLLDHLSLARTAAPATIELWRADLASDTPLLQQCVFNVKQRMATGGRATLLGISEADDAAVLALPGVAGALELPLSNCSVLAQPVPICTETVALFADAATSSAASSAAKSRTCVFGAWRPPRHTGMRGARLALFIVGIFLIVMSGCGCIGSLLVFNTSRKRMRTVVATTPAMWQGKVDRRVVPVSLARCFTGPQAQCFCHYALCCCPPLRNVVNNWQQSSDVAPVPTYADDGVMTDGVAAHARSGGGSPGFAGVMQHIELHDEQ